MKEIKEHEISNTFHWGLGVVPKKDDKIYVSISVGKYIITVHLFPVLCQRRSYCWKYWKWGSHLKNCYLCKGGRKCKDKFFNQSYCTLLFSRKENLKFFEVALSVVFAMRWLSALWMCEAIGFEILSIPQWAFTCFLQNGHKDIRTRCKVCSNLSSVLQQFTCVMLVTFINLEHLSRPTLVLLFKLWKGKCWLEGLCELFVKIIPRC